MSYHTKGIRFIDFLNCTAVSRTAIIFDLGNVFFYWRGV